MTTANLPTTVFEKLNALRRRLILWFLVDGAGRIAVAVLAMAMASFALDRLFRMDVPQRAILLLAMLAVVAWLLWRRVVEPLRRTPSDDALALQVETRHRELGDALITSMQLSRLQDPASVGASPALVAEAIRAGADAAGAVPFDDVIDTRKRNRVAASGAAAALAIVLLVAIFPGVAGTWAQRNLLLSPTVAWPQETHLQVVGVDENGVLTVPRGDDTRLKVNAAGVVPDIAYIDYRTDSGVSASEQMAHVGERGFQATFRNVLEPFSFRVRGNDDRTPRYRVRLVDRPAPESLGVKIILPQYTAKPAPDPDQPPSWVIPPPPENPEAQRPSGADTFYVLEGSTLEVSGRANKPIREASLVTGPDSRRPIDLAEDGRSFRFTIRPEELASGSYGVHLVDQTGLASRRPARFAVRVKPDETPMVQAELIGIGDMITRVATLPLEVGFSDDHGVVDLGLVHQHTGAIGSDENIEPSSPQWIDIDAVDDQLPTDRVEPFGYRLEAEPLDAPVGTHLVFYIAAVDNDAVGDPGKPGLRVPRRPEAASASAEDADPAAEDEEEPYQAEVAKVGQSTTFSLKVVSPDMLRDELLRQEGEQRVEFDRLRKTQEDMRTEAQALRSRLRQAVDAEAEVFTPDRIGVLADLEKDQRLAARRCVAIRDRFEQIGMEYRNNKLEGDNRRVTRRLTERVIDPLSELSEAMLPAAADQFDLARKTTLGFEDRMAALEEGIAMQAVLIRRMEQILAAMVKMEGFQIAINLAREALEAQEDVSQLTEKEIEERVEDTLKKLEGAFD